MKFVGWNLQNISKLSTNNQFSGWYTDILMHNNMMKSETGLLKELCKREQSS